MRKNLIVFLFLVSMCLCVLASCGIPPSTNGLTNNEAAQKPTEPSVDGNTSGDDFVDLFNNNNLTVSDDLITQFFYYYRLNTYELSMLPAFSSTKQADWDQLTLYIYLNFACPRDEAKYENFDGNLTKEKF